MNTVSLVQLYTALTQIMGEKVAAGDNGHVDVFIAHGDDLASSIQGLDLKHSQDGKLIEIFIKTGDFL